MSISAKRSKWVTLNSEVQGHIHAGLRSAPTTKSYRRWYDKRLRELQDARDEAKRDWDAVKPVVSRKERLIASANGHPDLSSTKAAIRLCKKHGIRY